MANEPLVRNVSDTAKWVAVYRAQESARSDALFHDPFAARLAGDRGQAIVDRVTRRTGQGWWMVVRTKLIDDLVMKSIAEGCERVLNLAAGLDTRPYRMALPESLEWVEADLGPMIDEKEKLLAGEKPRCNLRRERVDLADDAARRAFLDEATRDGKKTLVITEGLLVYLEASAVDALARDFLERKSIQWWMVDIASRAILDRMQKRLGSELASAPMHFAPRDGVAYFERLGWKAKDVGSVWRHALRWRRLPLWMRLFAFVPDPDPRNPGKAMWSAVVRFERE
ncbi:MAG TPA: class I SAM-dependent methyltransferase [Polyangiaceae bacterium]|jgi:methyltransferase (TIGR00027 family)